MAELDFAKLEKKWQQRWEKEKAFLSKENSKKPKCYVLEMYPYPSASFLHMGHVRNYTIGDAYARFKRMRGFNVLYPMGYDSFGLPAETAAKKQGIHPQKYTDDAIAKIMAYQKSLGNSYDWSRVISSHDPDYYRWNQHFFLKLYEKGLAYRKNAPVNWCPNCSSVLANEEAEGGKCWRCEGEVVQKDLEQWFFKITAYADRLLEDLKKIDWPDKIKTMQDNWIGRSEGINFREKVKGMDIEFEVYDSIPQTYVAQTFTVIAPEHSLVRKLVEGTKHEKEVMEFVEKIKRKKAKGEFDVEKDIEGVFTGRYVHNPFGKGDLPIWVASYVVAEYGTGVVNCSAHDERDFAFAKKYGIPLRTAMLPKDKEQAKKVENLEFCYHHADDGIIQEPVEFKGMTWKDSREPIIKYIEKKKIGRVAVHYKIRDWMVSRQRYWGTPIPMVHCPKCGVVPVPGKELPVLLPQDVDFKAAGNPLASCKSFVEVRCPKCKGPAKRETDTMGGFMDSSWYFLRYCSPKEKEFAFDKKAVNYWMPVDQYIGGAEHAVMHLLYARFFIKALKDMGLVSFDEPFSKLFNQGILYKDGHKMSKSFGNVVTQEEISKKYGIDTARIFLMFVSSPESQMEWSDEGIVGAARFVQRFWTLVNEAKKCKTRSGKLGTRDLMMRARLHSSVKSVTETVEGFKFNLTIGKLMELTNELQKYMEDAHKDILNDSVGTLIAMLSPFAPHICEEAWELTGNKKLVSLAGWPECNEDFIDRKLEMMGELVEDSKDDIREVLKIVGKEPKAINIYVSPLWKYTVYNEILDKAKGEAQIKDMLKHVMQMPEARQQGKHAVSFAERLARDARMLGGVLSQDDEEKALSEASQELEKLFNCKVKVMKAEASKSPKALRAEPGKPGIEIE